MTKGWKLLMQWKDGTSPWIPLKDLKELNPVETAEYAVANKRADEPAFTWMDGSDKSYGGETKSSRRSRHVNDAVCTSMELSSPRV
jgi:hypothetical protein